MLEVWVMNTQKISAQWEKEESIERAFKGPFNRKQSYALKEFLL